MVNELEVLLKYFISISHFAGKKTISSHKIAYEIRSSISIKKPTQFKYEETLNKT
jgi:hypothetical protein